MVEKKQNKSNEWWCDMKQRKDMNESNWEIGEMREQKRMKRNTDVGDKKYVYIIEKIPDQHFMSCVITGMYW